MKFYAPKYKQLDLGLLRSSLDELDKTNRWVALGDLLPWTELEKEYSFLLSMLLFSYHLQLLHKLLCLLTLPV